MQILVLVFGILLIALAAKGKAVEGGELLAKSFAFKQFFAWVLVVIVFGWIGNAGGKTFRPVSNALIGLMIIAMIIKEKGAFAKAAELVNSIKE